MMEGNVQHCERAHGFEAVLVSTLCPSHESFTSTVTTRHPKCYVSMMCTKLMCSLKQETMHEATYHDMLKVE